MNKYVPLVKSQISWMTGQIARFPPEHPKHRPEIVSMYGRIIQEHQELLAFLESRPENNENDSVPQAEVVPTPRPQAQQAMKRLIAPDLADLPPELLAELSDSAVRGESDQLVEIIDARGGSATLDEILIDLYRQHHELAKRTLVANKLYRLSKRGLIWVVPGKKGIYRTTPMQSIDDPVITLFNREAGRPS